MCFIVTIYNICFASGHNSLSRPKSLLVPSPSTKLLTLEEAQARTQAQINSPITADSKYIEVGEGPAALQGKFHTVIEFPTERYKASFKTFISLCCGHQTMCTCYSHKVCILYRVTFVLRKRQPIKSKKSPVGSWRSFFNLGKSSAMSKRKLHRNPSEPNELKAMALAGECCHVYFENNYFLSQYESINFFLHCHLSGGRGDTATLRSAKSEESLTSLHNVEGNICTWRLVCFTHHAFAVCERQKRIAGEADMCHTFNKAITGILY